MSDRSHIQRQMSSASSMTAYSTTSRRSANTTGRQAPSRATALSCTKCHKPLSSTLFVCTCDCVFCEECVYDHFQHSSQCPTCGKILQEKDFLQLTVKKEQPGRHPNSDLQELFSRLFVQGSHSRGSEYVQYSDACQAAFQAQQQVAKMTRFLYRQFFRTSQNNGESSGRMQAEYQALQSAYTQYRQETNGRVQELEKNIQNSQDRIQALERDLSHAQGTNKTLHQKVESFRRKLDRQGLGGTGSVGSGSHGQSRPRAYGGGAPEAHHPYPHFVGGGGGGGSSGNGHPEPTPIQINPSMSYTSDSRPSTATGAPAVRHHNQPASYAFTSGRSGSILNQSTHSSNLSMGGSSTGSGGPIQRLQQQRQHGRHYPQKSYGRPTLGHSSGFGGGRYR